MALVLGGQSPVQRADWPAAVQVTGVEQRLAALLADSRHDTLQVGLADQREDSGGGTRGDLRRERRWLQVHTLYSRWMYSTSTRVYLSSPVLAAGLPAPRSRS